MIIDLEYFTYQINFKHFYLPQLKKQKDNTYKYEEHPKATKCIIKSIHKESKTIIELVGYSVCNDKDQFSRHIGRFNSLLNCLKQQQFSKELKQTIITNYLLEFKFPKLETKALNQLNLLSLDFKFIVLNKLNIKHDFYTYFLEFTKYYFEEEINELYLSQNYLIFNKDVDDPKQFIRYCVLLLIEKEYGKYYN